jgi:hypothetical protein
LNLNCGESSFLVEGLVGDQPHKNCPWTGHAVVLPVGPWCATAVPHAGTPSSCLNSRRFDLMRNQYLQRNYTIGN